MKLEELDDVFGISMPVVKTQATRYSVATWSCRILDVLVVVLAGIPLYKLGSPSVALEVSVIIAVAVNMILLAVVKEDTIEAVRFYIKNKNKKVSLKTYEVDADALFSVLFSSGYKGLKSGLSLDAYAEMLNGACLRRRRYAKKFYKFLEKYASEEGQFSAYVLESGYYVAVKEGEE